MTKTPIAAVTMLALLAGTAAAQDLARIAVPDSKITIDVVATRLSDGTVHVKGVVPVKMTDFGITPPTAIFGRLRTGDDVKVNFELTVGSKAIAAATTDR